MGRVGRRRRQFVIKKNRKRREKLHRLREKYVSGSKVRERQEIEEKIRRIAPHLRVDEYLVGIENGLS